MNMTSVTSSNIEAIGYSPIDKKLRIDFLNGTSYEYDNVPQNEAQALMDAPSHGVYFNANIKNSYPFVKVA
jgi:hypothetical protein